MGISVNLLSWKKESSILLNFQRELGFALEALQGDGVHLALRGDLMVFLELWQEAWGSSQVGNGS